MSATFYFVASMVAYLAVIAAAVYFFVLADPEDSMVARFFQEKLPQRAWRVAERCLGEKALRVLEFFLDRLLMMFYCVVVFGSWSIIFSYIYPWIDEQDYVPHYHKYAGYIVFGVCFTSWRWACNTSPGTITAKNIQRYDHFPYDNLMFVPNRVCPTRNIPRLVSAGRTIRAAFSLRLPAENPGLRFLPLTLYQFFFVSFPHLPGAQQIRSLQI